MSEQLLTIFEPVEDRLEKPNIMPIVKRGKGEAREYWFSSVPEKRLKQIIKQIMFMQVSGNSENINIQHELVKTNHVI